MERLDKRIAATGRWSRKEAKALVKSGRVKVDGQRATDPEEKIPDDAALLVDGHLLSSERYTYLMLHKLQGVVSSTQDPREPTVLGLLPPHLRKLGLFPVGRLDKDAEGLLLLTNDGPLAHRLLAPGKHVDKCYYVEVAGELDETDQQALAEGIQLKDGTRCRPACLERLPAGNQALVTIQEGKYHQVKRMLAACGKPVNYLKRLTMGPLELDPSLPPGAWRPLTEKELAALEALRK